jgi:hypothetical protein
LRKNKAKEKGKEEEKVKGREITRIGK